MSVKMKLMFGALLLTAATSATSAQAQTWIGYEATGTGLRYTTDANRNVVGQQDSVIIRMNFTILVSGSVIPQNGITFYTDGSTFTANLPPYQSYSFTGGTSGVLGLRFNTAFPSGGGLLGATVNYADTDNLGGFPLAIASNQATGSVYQEFLNPQFGGGYNVITGTFNSFRIIGQVAGFSGIGLSAVPETATWGMMIVGFGMMGGAMRYRRRSATVTFA